MSRLKTLGKYILWIVGFALFSYIISFVGLNSTYKNLESLYTVPNNVNVEIAQATSVNGRIYGEITSTENDNLNGKYLKVEIFNKANKLMGTKYLKLENLEQNVPKKFAVNFKSERIKSYDISIVENSEELQREIFNIKDIYKDVFVDEEVKGGALLALVIALAFGI